MTLDHYCTLFSKLTRAPGKMWSEVTRNRAPHKPLLLLAVMDLVARGIISSRFISITGMQLVELNELFTDYWRSIVPVTQTEQHRVSVLSALHTWSEVLEVGPVAGTGRSPDRSSTRSIPSHNCAESHWAPRSTKSSSCVMDEPSRGAMHFGESNAAVVLLRDRTKGLARTKRQSTAKHFNTAGFWKKPYIRIPGRRSGLPMGQADRHPTLALASGSRAAERRNPRRICGARPWFLKRKRLRPSRRRCPAAAGQGGLMTMASATGVSFGEFKIAQKRSRRWSSVSPRLWRRA